MERWTLVVVGEACAGVVWRIRRLPTPRRLRAAAQPTAEVTTAPVTAGTATSSDVANPLVQFRRLPASLPKTPPTTPNMTSSRPEPGPIEHGLGCRCIELAVCRDLSERSWDSSQEGIAGDRRGSSRCGPTRSSGAQSRACSTRRCSRTVH